MILPTPLSGFILQSLCYRRFISHTPRVYHGLVGIGTIQNGEVQYSGNGISNLLNGETYGWVLLDSSTLNAPIITGWCWLEPWNFEWLSRNSWEWKNHPNWRTNIFQRGRSTTNQINIGNIPLLRTLHQIYEKREGRYLRDPEVVCRRPGTQGRC